MKSYQLHFAHTLVHVHVYIYIYKLKIKQSRDRPGVAHRVPGS